MCENPRKIIVNNEEVIVKCGKCDTCKRERSQEWAIKLINENKYHKKGAFITLTFDNKILLDKTSKAHKYGANPSFVFNINNSKEYFSKFIKRLRKHYKGKRITYYHVGEYGEKTKRPHHHCLIWGAEFEDRREIEKSKSGFIQYASKTLEELWACGRTTIEDINENNILYISQYCLKKFKNNELNKKYRPIQSFSNRSKMSSKWILRNYKNIEKGYIEDKDGKRYRIPKSYKNALKKSKKEEHIEAYRKYEENILQHINDKSNIDIINEQKRKSEIKRLQNINVGKNRDF